MHIPPPTSSQLRIGGNPTVWVRSAVAVFNRLNLDYVTWVPVHAPNPDRPMTKADVTAAETAYMGDDIPDIPVLKACGLSIAPANARPEVKAASQWVTKARCGDGAVREVAEEIMKAQGRWSQVLAKYSPSHQAEARRTVQ